VCEDDLAIAGQHLQLEHRLVGEAVAKGRGLDAQAGDRATERDRLQLRDDERHEAVLERHVDQLLVRRHRLHVRRACVRVERQHPLKTPDVQPAPARVSPGAEKVGGRLRQPNRCADGGRAVLPAQSQLARLVLGPGVPVHLSTLTHPPQRRPRFKTLCYQKR